MPVPVEMFPLPDRLPVARLIESKPLVVVTLFKPIARSVASLIVKLSPELVTLALSVEILVLRFDVF